MSDSIRTVLIMMAIIDPEMNPNLVSGIAFTSIVTKLNPHFSITYFASRFGIPNKFNTIIYYVRNGALCAQLIQFIPQRYI